MSAATSVHTWVGEGHRLVLRRADDAMAVLVMGGVALAVALRVVVAGWSGARSVPAGVLFAVALLAVAGCVSGFARPSSSDWQVRRAHVGRSVLWGLCAAAVLCAPVVVRHVVSPGAALPNEQFALWAGVVSVVAVAEEAVLRGALFGLVRSRHGAVGAVVVTSVVFAALHVPLYGWKVLPLDLAVGVALGALRVVSGSVTAPAVAHTVADVAGWWLQ